MNDWLYKFSDFARTGSSGPLEKEPEYVGRPQYFHLTVGEDPRPFDIVVDVHPYEADEGHAHLYFDANRNRDFTDDARIVGLADGCGVFRWPPITVTLRGGRRTSFRSTPTPGPRACTPAGSNSAAEK
jgi:hypothetical protein